MKGYRLHIKSLKWISAVDAGAQGPIANVALIKRAPQGLEVEATCKVIKVDAALGLVFGWALAGTLNGGKTPHVDLQDDAIEVNSTDFIKACVDYVETGAQSDVMHNERLDGRVVFAMPLVKEVNEALGIQSDVEGLAIAMKPSPATFKRFLSGELAAFSIGGMGERTPLEDTEKRAGKVEKGALYTNEVDGHQHKICVYENGSMVAEWATSAGATQGHSHGVLFEGGKVTILADSGHSHELADGQPGIAVVPEDSIVVVEASASPTTNQLAADKRANKSTQSAALPHGGSHSTEIPKMNIAKLVTAVLAMSPAQRSHVEKMAPDDLEGFFGKSAADRESIAKAAQDADPVVFKGAITGLEVRKSQGDAFRQLAESNEKYAELAKQATDAAAVEKAAREATELAKRAKETLPHLAGTDEVHCAILKAVESIADEKLRGEAIQALKGASAVAKKETVAPGHNPGDAPTAPITKRDAYQALAKGLDAFVVANKMNPATAWLDGLDAFVKTETGRALFDAHEAAK